MKTTKGVAIQGTCQTLEKAYLRLTAEPNPTIVRPLRVLKKSFRHVFHTFMSNGNYRYIEEQFRSIRQDIQVQHLEGSFVATMYATNARIALLYGDLDQFNQCQTQLIHILLKNPTCISKQVGLNLFQLYGQQEFECYRLLYLSLQQMDMDILRYLRMLCLSRYTQFNYRICPNQLLDTIFGICEQYKIGVGRI